MKGPNILAFVSSLAVLLSMVEASATLRTTRNETVVTQRPTVSLTNVNWSRMTTSSSSYQKMVTSLLGSSNPKNVTQRAAVSVTEEHERQETHRIYGNQMDSRPAGSSAENTLTEKSALHKVIANGRKVKIALENILKMVDQTFSVVSTENATVQDAIVESHNAFRRAVDPPACNMLKMKWNSEAAQTAAIWAKSCNEFHSTKEQRQIKGFSCGQNLFMSSFLADWSDVIASFDSEKVDFVYGSQNGTKNGNEIGHYTQVVWYKSFQVGCAVAQCPNSPFLYYYVCHYCPAGNTRNLIGTPYRNGTACGNCPNACDNKLCTNYCEYEDKYINCNTFVNKDGTCSGEELMSDCPATCKCRASDIK